MQRAAFTTARKGICYMKKAVHRKKQERRIIMTSTGRRIYSPIASERRMEIVVSVNVKQLIERVAMADVHTKLVISRIV
jgi:hypothetical protein